MDDFEGRTWTRVFMGELALMQNDPDTAEQLVTEALKILETHDFPWSLAGGWYVMGNVALARGQITQAMQYYVDSLVLVHDIQSIVQMLRHVLGVIEVLIRQEVCDPTHVYAVLTFIDSHQAAANDTRHRAQALLAMVEPGLTSEERGNALERKKTFTLDEIVDHYLALAGEGQKT